MQYCCLYITRKDNGEFGFIAVLLRLTDAIHGGRPPSPLSHCEYGKDNKYGYFTVQQWAVVYTVTRAGHLCWEMSAEAYWGRIARNRINFLEFSKIRTSRYYDVLLLRCRGVLLTMRYLFALELLPLASSLAGIAPKLLGPSNKLVVVTGGNSGMHTCRTITSKPLGFSVRGESPENKLPQHQ